MKSLNINYLDNIFLPLPLAESLHKLGEYRGKEEIRVVLNRMREEGMLKCLGTGRSAKWRKIH